MTTTRTRQRRNAAIQVLVFLTVTGALTFFITVQIARIGFGQTYKLTAVFDDASGLRKGDKVKIAGAPVGQVGNIRVRDGKAEVELDVSTAHRVPSDSEAAIRWRDLISGRVIYLIPGTATTMLRDGDRVSHTHSVVDLGDLISRIEPLVQGLDPSKINAILTSIYTAVDGGGVSTLLANVDQLTSTIATRRQTLATMLADFNTVTGALAKRDQQISAATDNLATLTQAYADNTTLVNRALDDLATMLKTTDKVAGANAANLSAMLDKLTFVAGGIDRNQGTLKAMMSSTWPKLQDMYHMFDRAKAAVGAAACITLVPGTCPFDMVLKPAPSQPDLAGLAVGGH